MKLVYFFLKYQFLMYVAFIPFNLLSEDVSKNNLVFHGGYTFETTSAQKTISIYISVFNSTDKDITINSVSSNLCEMIHFHNVIRENNVAKMSTLKQIIVKAGSEFYFQPGGAHIMCMGLKKKLIDNEEFNIEFFLSNKQKINSKIKVLNINLKNLNYM